MRKVQTTAMGNYDKSGRHDNREFITFTNGNLTTLYSFYAFDGHPNQSFVHRSAPPDVSFEEGFGKKAKRQRVRYKSRSNHDDLTGAESEAITHQAKASELEAVMRICAMNSFGSLPMDEQTILTSRRSLLILQMANK